MDNQLSPPTAQETFDALPQLWQANRLAEQQLINIVLTRRLMEAQSKNGSEGDLASVTEDPHATARKTGEEAR